MLQFTQEQITSFRGRVNTCPAILETLRKSVAEVGGHFLIPPSKAATWSGFYACPVHSVKLEFNIASPNEHRCPKDGEIFSGEPYDGAWWRILNEKNQHACYHAALLYLLEEKQEDYELAYRYLMEYARVYPDYEIHGDIPYNNPGKANAQTLCDAGWIKDLLLAFDIIGETMKPEDWLYISENLFRCCGRFLMKYRSNQIHNHEVVIDSAIAMIGLVLEDKEFVEFGMESKYGLRYQLDHGVLADGLWFEGTPAYHFYAMQQFMYFEMLACQTPHSFFNNSNFVKTLKFPLKLIQPDGALPLLNDAGVGYKDFAGMENIYELAWRETHDLDFLQLLQYVYKEHERCTLHSFFYGEEELPKAAPRMPEDYHSAAKGASGVTTMHGEDGRFLLVKHSPFGGEHDHYDRLAIHFLGMGEAALPDIGTCPYGAPMHYSYYKNTATHNTVCINGKNHPPANCKVYSYHKEPGFTALDVGVKWDGSYVPLDTFVIPQWSDEAYKGVEFRRFIAWFTDFFVDIFKVEAPHECTIDYTLHARGTKQGRPQAVAPSVKWSTDGPGRFLHSPVKAEAEKHKVRTLWSLKKGNHLEVLSLLQDNCECYYLLGPDNPSVSDLSYMIQRATGTRALFLNVISLAKDNSLQTKKVTFDIKNGKNIISVERNDGKTTSFGCPLIEGVCND